MQVIDSTPAIKQVAVTSLPQGTVFKITNNSVWMVVQGGRTVCLAAGSSATYDEGDVRDINNERYRPFSKIQVLEAVLHVQA